ncbi:unnamed protein product [Rhodiola kirilowii]
MSFYFRITCFSAYVVLGFALDLDQNNISSTRGRFQLVSEKILDIQSKIRELVEMDLREGQNITRPPLLEGNNYGYWRVRMKAFLKSQDESVWEAIENGWTPPVVTKDDVVSPLTKDKWTDAQKMAEAANSKAMNAIFFGVNGKNFKMISNCEIAKKAWDILRIAQEGTTKVKISRMETVTSKFENLRMQEDETIADFNTQILDISNEAFSLGEPMTEETLVRKVLRSLTKRFAMKALAIKEAHDVKTLRLDELMGNLQTHETDMNEEDQFMKNKSVGLKAEVSVVPDTMGDQSEQQFAMFAKNFSKFQKDGNFQRRNQSGDSTHDNNGRGIQCRECEGFGHIRAECINTQKKKNTYSVNWSDSDSEGETNNFVALSSSVVLAEDQSCKEEKMDGHIDHFLHSTCSDNEEITDEEIAKNYRELYQEWLAEVKRNKNLLKTVECLEEKLRTADAVKLEHLQTIADLKTQLSEAKKDRAELTSQKVELLAVISSLKIQIEKEKGEHPELMNDLKRDNDALKRREATLKNIVDALKCEIETGKLAHEETTEELNKLTKSVRMLNSKTTDLDVILGAQRFGGGHKGIGFVDGPSPGKTAAVKSTSQLIPADHRPRRNTPGKTRSPVVPAFSRVQRRTTRYPPRQ